MERNKSLELTVGIVVFIGLVILTYFVMKISEFRTVPSNNLKIVFGFVSGVGQNAPVRYCGVNAGEVKSVRTFFDPKEQKSKVEITVSINKDLKIEEDANAYIASLGLLGEKYIEIMPGSAGAGILDDGGILVGHDPLSVEWMAQRGEEMLNKLGRTIDSLNIFIGDRDNQVRFKNTIANLEELTSKLNSLSGDLKVIIGPNKEKISQTIANMSTASEKVDVTLDSINTILVKIKEGEGSLGKLLQDEKIYNDLEELVSELKKNPWKLLYKTKDRTRDKKEDKEKDKKEANNFR